MDNGKMKKVELDEAEMEQVSGGTVIHQVIIVSPEHSQKAVCPQCTYTRMVLPASALGYCPTCHVRLVIEE